MRPLSFICSHWQRRQPSQGWISRQNVISSRRLRNVAMKWREINTDSQSINTKKRPLSFICSHWQRLSQYTPAFPRLNQPTKRHFIMTFTQRRNEMTRNQHWFAVKLTKCAHWASQSVTSRDSASIGQPSQGWISWQNVITSWRLHNVAMKWRGINTDSPSN